jgi:lipoprotein-anchoring transpeptidase ErfK/SrfK
MRGIPRSRRLIAPLLAALTLSACSGGGTALTSADSTKTDVAPSQTPTAAAAAVITTVPANGAAAIRPDAPVKVSVTGGTVTTLAVTDSAGKAVSGALSADKTSWTPSLGLTPKSKYTVKVSATNADGQSSTKTATWTTLTPADRAGYTMIPSSGSTVGVGQPIVVQFNTSVDSAKRAAVEKRMVVTTTPKATGGWGWLDGKQLIWRPTNYWKPGTKVSVKANVIGIETHPKLWTSANDGTSFTIGDAIVSTVDISGHTMKVTRNGTLIRTIPITTGKPGFDTRNGIKVLMTHESQHHMSSATTGIAVNSAEGYSLDVSYAMRLTWTGEFVHARPWQTSQLGRENGSHGCTGMTTENAKWLFDQSRVGDVVKYINGHRSLEEWNGYTMWNESSTTWAKKSAL